MSFPEAHWYVTLHGKLWRQASLTEEWAVGLRYWNPGGVVSSQSLVNAVDTAVRSRWTSSLGVLIANPVAYSYAKLATIDVNGRYVAGTTSYESARTDLAALGSGALAPWPGQCAYACTLISAKPSKRGRASKGRIYLPPLSTTIGTDGRVSSSTATSVATAVAALIADIRNALGPSTVSMVYSDVGAGEKYATASVRCGLVVDTIRRRRRQLQESPPAAVSLP